MPHRVAPHVLATLCAVRFLVLSMLLVVHVLDQVIFKLGIVERLANVRNDPYACVKWFGWDFQKEHFSVKWKVMSNNLKF